MQVVDRAAHEELVAEAIAVGRPTYIYVGSDYCPSCFIHRKKVLGDSAVIAALSGFQCIKVDIGDVAWLRDLYGVQGMVLGTPTHIFLDPTGTIVYRHVGNFAGIGESGIPAFLSVLEEIHEGRADYYRLMARLNDDRVDIHQVARLFRFIHEEPKLRDITSDPLYDSLVRSGGIRSLAEAADRPVTAADASDPDLWIALSFLTERFDDPWFDEFRRRRGEFESFRGVDSTTFYILQVAGTNMVDGKELSADRVRESCDTIGRILGTPELRDAILSSSDALSTSLHILQDGERWGEYLALLLDAIRRRSVPSGELNYAAQQLLTHAPPDNALKGIPVTTLQDEPDYGLYLSLIIAWTNYYAGEKASPTTVTALMGKARSDHDRKQLDTFLEATTMK